MWTKSDTLMWLLHEKTVCSYNFYLNYDIFCKSLIWIVLNYLSTEANQIHVSVPTKRIYNFFSFPEKEFWIEIKVKKKNETEPPVENYLKLNDNE